MKITRTQLDKRYSELFRGIENTEKLKAEILSLFGTDPEDGNEWTEQDIYEQIRKLAAKYKT